MLNIFKKSEKEDPELGQLIYDKPFWEGKHEFHGETVELSLDGTRKEINSFARSYWLKIREDINELWGVAIQFAQAELPKMNVPWQPIKTDFVLTCISIHKEASFDRGHLVFWFEIKQDNNGSYYISFRDEKPFFLHRDN